MIDYAAVYADAYGEQVMVPDLLARFLDNDRAFQRLRRECGGSGEAGR